MLKWTAKHMYQLAGIACILSFSVSINAGNTDSLPNWQLWSEHFGEFRKTHKLPGFAVAVVKDGKMVWGNGYGFADSDREVPVTTNTPFWIASVSKTFVGLTFLHLAHEQKIDLDQLASETPKFDRLCDWLAGTTIPFAKGLDCTAPITLRHILHHQVNAPVGENFMYNPIMYSRLSRVLEHQFGEGVDGVEGRHNKLGQLITQYILEPAGMQRTMASMWDKSRADIYVDMADGFSVDDKGHITKQPQPDKHIAGGAGVVSTVADLAKYEIAFQQGVIASGEVEEKLMRPAQFNDGSPSPYGYGWYFQTHEGKKLMWHSGWDPDAGYSAMYLRLPEQNMAFIALANGEGIWWGNSLTQAEIHKSPLAQQFLQLAKQL